MDQYIISQKSRKSFEIASLVLAILSVTGFCCFYLSIPAGALAIIFASLSRGNQKHRSSLATITTILGVIGIVLACLLITISVIYCMLHFNSVEELLHYYSDTTGINYNDLYNMIYGN